MDRIVETSGLITVTPELKEKGFKDDRLKLVPATPEDRQVLDQIQDLTIKTQYQQLASDQKRIIDLMTVSYQKRLTCKSLDAVDYVLAGHELVEFDRL